MYTVVVEAGLHRHRLEIEQRREVARAAEDIPIEAEVEQEDDRRERIEWRRDLVLARLRHDGPVEIDEPCHGIVDAPGPDTGPYLVLPAPRPCGERCTYVGRPVRARDAVVRGLRVAAMIQRRRAPRVRIRLVELPWDRSAPTAAIRLDGVTQTVVLQLLARAPHRVDVGDASAERVLHQRRVVPPGAEVLVDRVRPVWRPPVRLVDQRLERTAVRHPLDAELAL